MKRGLLVLAITLIMVVSLFPFSMDTFAQNEAGNIDVVLVIDNSGSMRDNDPQNLRIAAAKLFIDLASENDKIGIVIMSDSVGTKKLTPRLIPISDRETRKALKDSISTPIYGENTNMGKALEAAFELLDEDPEPNLKQFVVLLSDGLPTPFDSEDSKVMRVVSNFNRYWKIFPIALIGSAESQFKADPAYMEQKLAEPTSGKTFIADTPEELIDAYIDIFALLQDDRYVDRVGVEAGGARPIINVVPDHRLAQISFIVNRAAGNTTHALNSPDKKDMLRPDLKPIVYTAREPEYEVFTIPAGQDIQMDGMWEMWLDGTGTTNIVVLSRSNLRIRLPQPVSIDPEDDQAVRYHPAGKPMLIVSGALDPKGQWAKGLAPAASVETTLVSLTDEGGGYDQEAGNGFYTGIYPHPLPSGIVPVRIEVPLPNPQPIHLVKTYDVHVADLPTLKIELPPPAELSLNDPVIAKVFLEPKPDIAIDSLDFSAIFVRRPDGQLVYLESSQLEEYRYQFEYLPQVSGEYTFTAIASIQAHDAQRNIPYVDFAETTYESAVASFLRISPEFNEMLEISSSGEVTAAVNIISDSLQEEKLRVIAESPEWGEIDIIPQEVPVQPRDLTRVTFALITENANDDGTIILKFSSENPSVQLENDTVTWDATVRGNTLGILAIFVILVVIGVGGIFFYTRVLRN